MYTHCTFSTSLHHGGFCIHGQVVVVVVDEAEESLFHCSFCPRKFVLILQDFSLQVAQLEDEDKASFREVIFFR